MDVMIHFIKNCQDRDLGNKNKRWTLYWHILIHRSSSDLFEWVLDNIDLKKFDVSTNKSSDWTVAKLPFRYSSKSCILKMIKKYKGSLEGRLGYDNDSKTNICQTMNENDKLIKSDVIDIMQCILETYNGWKF